MVLGHSHALARVSSSSVHNLPPLMDDNALSLEFVLLHVSLQMIANIHIRDPIVPQCRGQISNLAAIAIESGDSELLPRALRHSCKRLTNLSLGF